MSSHPPYIFGDFLAACKAKTDIQASYDAQKDARTFFNLPTEESIFDFISNGGLEELVLQDVELWRYNPKPQIPIYVDAYGFKSSIKRGYIAFLFIPYKNKWYIKSFKLNENQHTSLSGKTQKGIT